jgi:ABC-type spermidine/putrescine transport system permease subunit II
VRNPEAAVQSAFTAALTHAMHICALTAAAALVLAALAALLIEHGPRLLARRPQSGAFALSESIADTLPDS